MDRLELDRMHCQEAIAVRRFNEASARAASDKAPSDSVDESRYFVSGTGLTIFVPLGPMPLICTITSSPLAPS